MTPRASAQEIAIGFDLGLYDRASVVEWVGAEVVARGRVEGSLLDLAVLAGRTDEDISRDLQALASTEATSATHAELTLACMGVLVEANVVGLRAAISHLFGMANSDELSEGDRAAVYYLDDGYDLALAGYQGTLEEVRADFVALTSRYRHLLVGVP